MSKHRPLISRQFTSAVERIRWAQHDIDQVKEFARQFFTSPDTHERISEMDTDRIYHLDKIRFKAALPSEIAKYTVSAIENLRAALDHGACAVVPHAFKKRTSFPFGDTKREFNRHLKSKAKYVPAEIQSVFAAFKPYKRGNPPLWALNKVANTHKHTTIVRPGIDIKYATFVSDPTLDVSFRYSRPKWNRRKNEIIITRMTRESTSHHDIDISLGVAFGKVPVFGGKPVLSVLRFLSRNIEKILWLMECRARKIGIVK